LNFLTNMSKIDDVSVAQVAVSPDTGGCHWLKWIARGLLIWFALPASAFSESLPVIVANQNHSPAGILRDGVLSVHLEIAKGDWHPEADDGMALAVYAFGESGHPLQNPGPIIRVPQGTEVHASLHNSLTVPITVCGLGEPGRDAAVHVAPRSYRTGQFQSHNAWSLLLLGRVWGGRCEAAIRDRLGTDRRYRN
jgi:hypothetical protein